MKMLDNRAVKPLVFAVRVPLTARALTMQTLLWCERTSVANFWSKHWLLDNEQKEKQKGCMRICQCFVSQSIFAVFVGLFMPPARANFKKKNCKCSGSSLCCFCGTLVFVFISDYLREGKHYFFAVPFKHIKEKNFGKNRRPRSNFAKTREKENQKNTKLQKCKKWDKNINPTNDSICQWSTPLFLGFT